MPDFKLKPHYSVRPMPRYCVDRPDGHLWQFDVYQTALNLARDNEAKYVVDFGCGSGEKLQMFMPQFKVIGIDAGSNIEYCWQEHRKGTWIDGNLETMNFDFPMKDAVYICADVIEHLVNPEPLLRAMQGLQKTYPTMAISTPDRDLTHGVAHMGPPPNLGHVREWNMAELRGYLNSLDFTIHDIRHIPCMKDDNRLITTMAVL